ncbi:MAG: 3'-5' exonuclease [Epsilonproteobacteria bacterium]|nr:3'-5' exonuclease [Campylobacterota bacterium]
MLPAKTRILQRASVFNQETIQTNLTKMQTDKSFINKLPSQRDGLFFRNYRDYLVSLVDDEVSDFASVALQKAFSSKYMLEWYKQDYNSLPDSKKARKVVVFDTETTDMAGYIVSYALVEYDMLNKEVINETYELINPQAKINPEAYAVHKISQDDVKDKPTFHDIRDKFLSILQSADLVVGHNVLYDFGVLKRELERDAYHTNYLDVAIFDTMYFAADVVELDKKKMPRLEEAVRYFFPSATAMYHNALEDVKMTLKVFEKLVF